MYSWLKLSPSPWPSPSAAQLTSQCQSSVTWCSSRIRVLMSICVWTIVFEGWPPSPPCLMLSSEDQWTSWQLKSYSLWLYKWFIDPGYLTSIIYLQSSLLDSAAYFYLTSVNYFCLSPFHILNVSSQSDFPDPSYFLSDSEPDLNS